MRRFAVLTACALPVLALVLAGCPEDRTKALAAAKIAYDLGVNHLNNNQARQALEQFLKAVENNPDFPEAHNALGLLYFGIRDFRKAEEHYKKAVDLNPEFSDAFNNLGRLYIEVEQYDKAVESCRKALSNMLYQTPQFATNNLGWALYKMGKAKEGLEQLRKSVVLDPKFCLGHRSVGLVLMDLGEGLDALRAFTKFREACASDAEAVYYTALVKHRFKLAKPEEVTADLERSLELNPAFCPSLILMGRLLDETMKHREAIGLIEKHIDSCPESAEAYQLAGTIYYKLNQDQKAAAYLETCARKFPDTVAGQTCKELSAKYRQK